MRRALVALALATALSAGVAHAVGGDDAIDPTTAALDREPATIEGAVPGPPPPAGEVDRLTQAITATLRCPVCQGLSVADSTSAAAVMMQRRTRALVEAGYTREDIEDYYVSKYGEFILLDPRLDGLNRLAWVGPLLAALIGLGLAASFLRSTAPPASPAPRGPAPRTGPAAPGDEDPYKQKLLSEVDDA